MNSLLRHVVVCSLLLSFAPRDARADVECLRPTIGAYEVDRAAGQTTRAAGEVFLTDLAAVSPGVAANVRDAARYQLQQEEADKFARNQQYVLWAYGLAWLLPLGFSVYVWRRHRQVTARLDHLERQLS